MDIKSLVENYSIYIDNSDKLHKELLKALDYNTKVTSSFNQTGSSGKGSVSSKVEKHAIIICTLEDKILKLENKISSVNIACKVLNNSEKEIINLIKSGYTNKISKIAKAINRDKNYVYNTRNRAFKKMEEYLKDIN